MPDKKVLLDSGSGVFSVAVACSRSGYRGFSAGILSPIFVHNHAH